MNANDVKTICVVGSGAMGQQIAMVNAMGGYTVYVTDTSESALGKAKAWAYSYLDGRVSKAKITQEEAGAVKERLAFIAELKVAAETSDLVIEAIVENLEVKRNLFKTLDALCPPHTILTTNSSSLASSLIADATKRPQKVCNMHYFNPATVMELVEVVKGPHTSDETADIVMQVARKTGKTPILLKKEINGFVVNRILRAVIGEAIDLLDNGIASYEDIDIGVEKGLRHPMGPFKLADQIGIDVLYSVRQETYKASGKEEDKPSQVLETRYKEGNYGRKSGKGFYDYSAK